MILSLIKHHGNSLVVVETQRYPFNVCIDVYDVGCDHPGFQKWTQFIELHSDKLSPIIALLYTGLKEENDLCRASDLGALWHDRDKLFRCQINDWMRIVIRAD